MSWCSWLRRDRLDPRQLAHDTHLLHAAEAQATEVKQVSERLIRYREQNHFGEGILQAIQGAKDEKPIEPDQEQ